VGRVRKDSPETDTATNQPKNGPVRQGAKKVSASRRNNKSGSRRGKPTARLRQTALSDLARFKNVRRGPLPRQRFFFYGNGSERLIIQAVMSLLGQKPYGSSKGANERMGANVIVRMNQGKLTMKMKFVTLPPAGC